MRGRPTSWRSKHGIRPHGHASGSRDPMLLLPMMTKSNYKNKNSHKKKTKKKHKKNSIRRWRFQKWLVLALHDQHVKVGRHQLLPCTLAYVMAIHTFFCTLMNHGDHHVVRSSDSDRLFRERGRAFNHFSCYIVDLFLGTCMLLKRHTLREPSAQAHSSCDLNKNNKWAACGYPKE